MKFMSLDAFKMSADNVIGVEILEKIKGGTAVAECHTAEDVQRKLKEIEANKPKPHQN